MRPVRVGVIDVGANTLRLLVAASDSTGLETVQRERVRLGLGEYVERECAIPRRMLAAAGRVVRKQAETAHRLGCARVEIVVTSPGRQAVNGDELVKSLSRAAGTSVRVLSAEEEAAFAYRGAIADVESLPKSVGVVDVGGGSTQISVGSRDDEPTWVRSLDLGSLRLTQRTGFDDPPASEGIDEARRIVEPVFSDVEPPLPQAAYATGGSARGVARLVGDRLGPEELAVAVHILSARQYRRVAKTFELSPQRARTLAAGVLLLESAQRLLGVPLEVARGGLREGIALSLLDEEAVAA
jgi:exopolyphosphatase/guanosine-5'-triphosphate,3'-diphosphate pyrophosphatase